MTKMSQMASMTLRVSKIRKITAVIRAVNKIRHIVITRGVEVVRRDELRPSLLPFSPALLPAHAN